MIPLPPRVALLTGKTVTRCDHIWERSRFEWRVGDGAEPAAALAAFLDRYGLAESVGKQRLPDVTGHRSGDICGATVLISAAGAAAMIGVTGDPGPVPDVVAIVYGHSPGPVPAWPRQLRRPGRWRVGAWEPSWSEARHAAAVDSVRAAIARGDVYQVNLVGHASAPYEGDPLPALRRVAALPGARYAQVVGGDGWAVACASPETLVEVVGDRVTTRPIKGTAPATASGRAHLLASVKERAEHIMIVDLERNDLGHVAVPGSVTVSELYSIKQWSDLWQAESVVDAVLRPGVDLAGLLRAVCPGGSVTGAPKLAALAEIAALEPTGRGPSMGALGWVGHDGLDLGLTIRTVAADPERLHLWAGGGITWDSDPAAEVAEAAAKAAPIRRALTAD